MTLPNSKFEKKKTPEDLAWNFIKIGCLVPSKIEYYFEQKATKKLSIMKHEH